MTRSQTIKSWTKNAAIYVALTLAVIIAIPVLAALAYGLRVLVPVGLVAVAIALAASPVLRRWFLQQAEPDAQAQARRHGLLAPRPGFLVHRAHAWAAVQSGDRARIGVDALAVAALGNVTAFETAPMGSRVEQGQRVCTILHGQRRLDVLAPISGEVALVSPTASANPSSVTAAPYDAWLVELKATGPTSELGGLVEGSAVTAWFGREVDRFVAALASPSTAASMADGGALHADLSAVIDDSTWERINKSFFA